MRAGIPLFTAIILLGMVFMDSWLVNLVGAGLSAVYIFAGIVVMLSDE